MIDPTAGSYPSGKPATSHVKSRDIAQFLAVKLTSRVVRHRWLWQFNKCFLALSGVWGCGKGRSSANQAANLRHPFLGVGFSSFLYGPVEPFSSDLNQYFGHLHIGGTRNWLMAAQMARAIAPSPR